MSRWGVSLRSKRPNVKQFHLPIRAQGGVNRCNCRGKTGSLEIESANRSFLASYNYMVLTQ